MRKLKQKSVLRFKNSIDIILVSLSIDIWIDWSIGSTVDHILLDIWLCVEITIHVWPSSILSCFINKVLVTVGCHHLLLSLLQLKFVVEIMLSVRKVLDCPLVFFSIFILFSQFVILYLLSSCSVDILDLVRSEALEVVWHESVRSKLRFGCLEVFSHDVAHVSSGNLELVRRLLVFSPSFFSIFFLLGESLVILLHLL